MAKAVKKAVRKKSARTLKKARLIFRLPLITLL